MTLHQTLQLEIPTIVVTSGLNNHDCSEDFYESFLELEVEDNHDQLKKFRIKMAFRRDISGDLVFPDGDKLDMFKKITINAKFPSGNIQNLIVGYVTNISPHIDQNEDGSYIVISGMEIMTPNPPEKNIGKCNETLPSSQGILYCHFGPKTNLNSLDITVEGGILPTESKQKIITKLTRFNEEIKFKLGKKTLKDFADKGDSDYFRDIVKEDNLGFVYAKGLVDSEKYSSLLETKKIVTIYGVGDMFSGDYYVTKVTHSFSYDKYVQYFESKRNALYI